VSDRDEAVLSVLMPVFDEVGTVLEAIDRLAKHGPQIPVELVVVDDGSTDGTSELLERKAGTTPWMRLHRHPSNRGKGAAIRTAISQASGRYACIYDADLEYDPADLQSLLDPLVDGRAEAVFGVRAFGGHAAHSYWFVVGNRVVTWITNLLYNCYVRDIMTCWKLMSLDLLRSLEVRSDGFELEAEITAKLLRGGHRIYEVPASYRARSRREGKKLRGLDALGVIATLVRLRLRRS
jgi:glycosyltransferase involved in cell wall biosynthesis